jgi:hypothetical protein
MVNLIVITLLFLFAPVFVLFASSKVAANYSPDSRLARVHAFMTAPIPGSDAFLEGIGARADLVLGAIESVFRVVSALVAGLLGFIVFIAIIAGLIFAVGVILALAFQFVR